MFTYQLDTRLLRWEVDRSHEIRQANDTFRAQIRHHRYLMGGYRAMINQFQSGVEAKKNAFFLRHVERDLKKKGINIGKYNGVEAFQENTHGVFMSYFTGAIDALETWMDSCRAVPFFGVNESEIDVVDEKLRALLSLDIGYLVHADILLDSECYDFLLFHATCYEPDTLGFRHHVEKCVFDTLHGEAVFEKPLDDIITRPVPEMVELNRKKGYIEVQACLQHLDKVMQDYLLTTAVFDEKQLSFQFDAKSVQSTLATTELNDVDKIKILTIIVKDLEREFDENLRRVSMCEVQPLCYHGVLLLTAQAKLVMAINALSHSYYCGILTQLTKLEIAKAALIRHFIKP